MNTSEKPATSTVGQAARAAGITPKAARLYEAKGLLPPAERSDAGYRSRSSSPWQLRPDPRRS